MAKIAEDTPLIKQFFEVKAQHPEALLLYRVGDFYESYSDDAVTASRVLGLVLTKKSNGDKGPIPMAGFPHHAIEGYLTKLVRAGYKVAVCDQLEDPKFAKKLVKRAVSPWKRTSAAPLSWMSPPASSSSPRGRWTISARSSAL